MDPLTLTMLATQAVTLLKPFLGKATEGAATKLGEAAFNALKTKLSNHPSGQEALLDFQNNLGNQDYEAALRVQVEKALSSDIEFETRLRSIVSQSPGAGGVRIEQHAGDNSTQYGYVGGHVHHRDRT